MDSNTQPEQINNKNSKKETKPKKEKKPKKETKPKKENKVEEKVTKVEANVEEMAENKVEEKVEEMGLLEKHEKLNRDIASILANVKIIKEEFDLCEKNGTEEEKREAQKCINCLMLYLRIKMLDLGPDDVGCINIGRLDLEGVNLGCIDVDSLNFEGIKRLDLGSLDLYSKNFGY